MTEAEIELTNTKRVARVSAHDHERLNQHRWSLHSSGRAVRRRKVVRLNLHGVQIADYDTVYMHRVVVDLPCGDPRVVVHLDGDYLNNQRQNLAVRTRAQVSQSCTRPAKSTSRFRGLTRYQNGWTVRITANKRVHYLGRFPLEQEELAAQVYDEAARVLHGRFATLNVPRATVDERAEARRWFQARAGLPSGRLARPPPVTLERCATSV